jgi:hypothetical protein
MFFNPEIHESLRRLRKLTVGLEQDFSSFLLLLIHLCFSCPHPGDQSRRGDKNRHWSRRGKRNFSHG